MGQSLETPRRTWRERVLHAVDLTVAFVTLEDALPHEDSPLAEADARHTYPRAAGAPDHDDLSGPALAAGSPRSAVNDRHVHRKPLRPMPRSRRPGATSHRPQVCIAPTGLVPSSAPKRRARLD